MKMNHIIRNQILQIISVTKRPIETRGLARRLAKRYQTSIYRIYGILSGLTRANKIIFIVKQAGGPSYIR